MHNWKGLLMCSAGAKPPPNFPLRRYDLFSRERTPDRRNWGNSDGPLTAISGRPFLRIERPVSGGQSRYELGRLMFYHWTTPAIQREYLSLRSG